MDSPLFQNLTRMGESNFARELLKTVEAKDFDKAMDMIVAKFEEMGRKNKDAQEYFARDVLGINVSILKEWTETSAGIVVVQQKSLAETKKYLADVEAVHNALNTAMGVTFDVIYTGMEKTNKKYEEFSNIIKPLLSSSVPSDVQNVSPEVTNPAIRELRGLPILKEGPQAPEKRAVGGPAYSGRSYVVGERGPELFTPNQSGTVVASLSNAQPQLREMVDTEKESNKALDDILTVLKEMQGPPGGQGGAMGFGGLGTGGPPSAGGGGGGAGTSVGSIGQLMGTVHGYGVNAYAGQTGQKLFDPMSGSLGGGLGGSSAMFGPGQHMGIDIMGKIGSSVYAIKDGVIVKAPRAGGGIDQVLTIKHADGTYTRYLHQGYLPGQYVGKPVTGGSVVGSSGYRNAPHSHVEFWVGEPGARGSQLGNLRAIMGWDKNNLPEGGKERVGRGPSDAPAVAGTATQTTSLAESRTQQAKELDDPKVRDKLMAYAYAEVGHQGPKAVQAFIEEVFNQSASRGKSINDVLASRYFPGGTHAAAARRGAPTAVRDAYGNIIGKVVAGSNISGYATGNASGNVGFGGGPQTFKAGGERFGIEGQDIPWARRQAEVDAQRRESMNKALADKIELRTGKVSATVDFGDLAKKEEAKMPFFKLKQGVEPQNQSVRESQVVPGDSGHSDWVP
jgi:murein DD-endopeptidase MepM/ murein hydrolase activator NlpD